MIDVISYHVFRSPTRQVPRINQIGSGVVAESTVKLISLGEWVARSRPG